MSQLARIKQRREYFTRAGLRALQNSVFVNFRFGYYWECDATMALDNFLKSKDLFWWKYMVQSMRYARQHYQKYPQRNTPTSL